MLPTTSTTLGWLGGLGFLIKYFFSHFKLKTKTTDRNRARPNKLIQRLRVGKVPVDRITREGEAGREGIPGGREEFQAKKKHKTIILQISPDPSLMSPAPQFKICLLRHPWLRFTVFLQLFSLRKQSNENSVFQSKVLFYEFPVQRALWLQKMVLIYWRAIDYLFMQRQLWAMKLCTPSDSPHE